MYGTIMRAKMKRDCVRDFFALGKEWDGQGRKRAVGYINSEILWEDKEEGRFCMVVHFTSREAYQKNAASAEQDAFYRRMRACLEADPQWIDGAISQWDGPYAHPPAWGEPARQS
jgi:quinol monooxygenase YgiN